MCISLFTINALGYMAEGLECYEDTQMIVYDISYILYLTILYKLYDFYMALNISSHNNKFRAAALDYYIWLSC